MKILLVQVADEFDKNLYLPLAISSVWSHAKQNIIVEKHWQVSDVLITKIDIDEYVQGMDEVDLVAISVYTWNNEYSKNFASRIKSKFPNTKVVVGGPQIPRHDETFFDNHPMFDIAVLGEGELVFEQILQHWPKQITDPNVFYKGGRIIPGVSRTKYLDKLASPIQNGFYDWIMENEMRRRPRRDVLWNISYETMRGCPYHCNFCEIGASYFNKVKMFDISKVYDDIDWMAKNRIEYVSVADNNWGMFERDVEITKYVIDKKLETGYPKFWNVAWAKNNSERLFEISLLDKQANTRLFKGVTFAYQSMSKETLEAIERFNLDHDKIKLFLEKYKQYDIPTYSEIIWPLPLETVQTFKDTIQSIVDLGHADWLQINHLEVLPNLKMSDDDYLEKYKLEVRAIKGNTDWHRLTKGQENNAEKTYAVVSTSTADHTQVIDGLMFAWLFVNLYYHGWFYYGVNYLKETKRQNAIDVVDAFMNYCLDKENIISKEYKITRKGYEETMSGETFSGRKIFSNEDLNWEFKSATGIVLYKNRDQLYELLSQFMQDVYGVRKDTADEVCKLNSKMYFDHEASYPLLETFDRVVVKDCLGVDSGTLEISHWDKDHSHSLFTSVQNLYHFQRKTRYWKCSFKKRN